MKRSKAKLAVVSVAALTFLTAGTVYAYSDAGAQLQNWYDKRFKQASNQIDRDTVQPGLEEMQAAVDRKAEKLIGNAKEELQATEQDVSLDVNGSIWIANGAHLDALRKAKNKLLRTTIGADFDQYVSNKQNEIDRELEQTAADYVDELTKALEAEAAGALNTMESNAAKAKDGLKAEIESTQSALNEKLIQEKGTAKTEVIGHLEKTIDDARGQLNAYAADQVERQEQTIEQTGAQLERQAVEALDATLVINLQP